MKPFLRRRATIVLSLLVLFSSFLLACWFFFIPPLGIPPTKIVYIKRGMHLRQVAGLLQEGGIIRNKYFFILVTTLLREKALIKAGEYEFDSRMQPLEVLDTLVKGQVKRHLVTIPEGFTLSQIAQLMEDQKTGKMKGEILAEKVLSAIIEMKVPLGRIAEILQVLDRVQKEIDTVISVGVSSRCLPEGMIPHEEWVKGSGFPLSRNGKTNLGLGRPLLQEE